MFEIVEKTNYPPAIKNHTEEEARQKLLEGEEFMLIEIQVIGIVRKDGGRESFGFDYLAAMSQKALLSEWMKEKIRLISKVCEDTVMGIDKTHDPAHPGIDPKDKSPGAVPVQDIRMVFHE
jgi:hypothetical protein